MLNSDSNASWRKYLTSGRSKMDQSATAHLEENIKDDSAAESNYASGSDVGEVNMEDHRVPPESRREMQQYATGSDVGDANMEDHHVPPEPTREMQQLRGNHGNIQQVIPEGGAVDFGVLEGFLQENVESKAGSSSSGQPSLGMQSESIQLASKSPPPQPPLPPLQSAPPVSVNEHVVHSVPSMQPQGGTEQQQEASSQAADKENKEFVLFSWKDAKEFATMSWHLTNCKICRETFETWKSHAIKEHDVKPVVHKLNPSGGIEQKPVGQKDVLTQNVSNNQQVGKGDKVSPVLKKVDATASMVLKHLTTKYKPKTDVTASASLNKPKTNETGSSSKPSISSPTTSEAKYHCGLCNLHYKTEPELKLHLNIHAGQRIAFKCQKCDRIFLHQGMLQRHMAVHKPQNTLCKICGRKFPDVQKARRHRYTHGKKQSFKCSKCGKTYTSMQSLRIHERTHTGEGMMACRFCGKQFPSKFSLTSHERIHTGEKPYKCVFCNEHFITHSAMSYHKQIHTGFKYMCQHCGKGYRDKSNLREHERIHTGEKPFKCDHCPEAFTTTALLKYHRQVHTGERFECQVCKKRYRSRGILNTHMRSHTDERPFICRFCGKGFREKATLNTHEKGVHLGVKFTCELCKREFTQRSALKTHEKGMHGGLHGTYGGNKSKKTTVQRKSLPCQLDSSNPPVEAISVAVVPAPPVSEQAVSSSGYHIETEFVNSALVPIIRPGPPDPYDQVNAAHASTHPPYPMSNSDFHTMVDSLIQFSKDH